MSYSFSVRAASKAEALQKIAAELDKVVAAQAVHAKDRSQAMAAAEAFVGLVAEPSDSQEVSVSVNGSVGWTGEEMNITGASVGVSVGVLQKTA